MLKSHNFSNYLVVTILLLLFYACSQRKGVKDIIAEAASIVEQQPDSALLLLNSILFPENLNKNLFNKYHLLLLQAKDKCDNDIASDTIIFSVKAYYVQKKDYSNAALAAFYSGRVRHEQHNIEKVVEAYHEAEQLADKIDNYNLNGLIQSNLGILNMEHSSYEKAIELIKKAVFLYDKAKNYKNKINALRIIGDCFLFNKKIDSAFYYYDKSLKLAGLYNLRELQSNINESMGVAYCEQGKYEQAKTHFYEALALPNDSMEQGRILLNIANVYIFEDKTDSVNSYLEKASDLQINDPEFKRNSFLLRSKIEEKQNRYKEALDDYKIYHQSAIREFDSKKSNILLEIQRKYDFEKLKNTQNQWIIKQQKVVVLLSLTLLTTGMIIFILYRKFVQNKKLSLETEKKIAESQKVIRELSEEKQAIRNTLFHHFEIMKKTFLIESEINGDERISGQKLLKKFYKIVYGQDTLDWHELYSIINNLEPGFFDMIRRQYPHWNEKEFRVFCMSYKNRFNDNDISIILHETIPMIRKIRNKIRKDMGSPKYSHGFISFLKNN